MERQGVFILKLKVFTFRFSESKDGFDDEIMQVFIADKEVIEFSEHFFVYDKIPYLTVILSYRDMDRDRRKIISREDPRKELDGIEKETYDALRAWRSQRARQEGIPPYMIANNKQLAGMIKKRIMGKSGLSGIMGFGESKVSQYGEEILTVLKTHLKPDDKGSINTINNKEEKTEDEKETRE